MVTLGFGKSPMVRSMSSATLVLSIYGLLANPAEPFVVTTPLPSLDACLVYLEQELAAASRLPKHIKFAVECRATSSLAGDLTIEKREAMR